jgi:hypothetical protein
LNDYFDRTLVADFPTLYGQRHGDIRATAMCWGFEVGDGWEKIIRDLSGQLEFLNEQGVVHVEAVQVKEKFGTLRYYASVIENSAPMWADIVWALTDWAEAQSGWTCEECGEWGTRRNDGWIATRCDACEAKRNEVVKPAE